MIVELEYLLRINFQKNSLELDQGLYTVSHILFYSQLSMQQ